MIHDVDETLRRLLVVELAKVPGCPVRDPEQVTFDSPADAEAVQDGEAHVNLFLHDLRENVDLRDESYRVISKPEEGIAGKRGGVVRIDLSYLVAVYAGGDMAVEHRLLADVLGVLLRCVTVPEAYLAGLLEERGPYALLLEVAQPEHLANSDPAALWQALGGRLRPALSLKATAPFDPFETKWTKVVREAVLGIGPGISRTLPRPPLATSGTRVSAAGVVAHQESEQPLAGVAVTVEGRDETATTDDRGFFFLLDLPPGPHTLSFHKRGYQAQDLRTVAPPPGRADQLAPAVVALRPLGDAEWAASEAARTEAALNAPGLVEAERVYRVSISGRLRFPDGPPAAYIPVRVGRQRTSTDAEGMYCFVDLPPGKHAVLADVPGRGEVEVVTRNGAAVVAPVESEKEG